MKTSSIVGLGALALLSSCSSTPGTNRNDHWNMRGIAPSVGNAFLSYDAERDGSYIDHQWRKKKSIDLTVRRHFFNQNPENPFQAEQPEYYEPREPHSILPRPWYYFHAESVVTGAIIYAASGAFIPIPVDSILGTLSPGGDEEFAEGIRRSFRPGEKVRSASFLNASIGLEQR